MKILIIGGYGTFGKRLVTSLAAHYSHHLIIAGRSLKKARALQHALIATYNIAVEAMAIDVFSEELAVDIINLSPDLVVNASGPFQTQVLNKTYGVAEACLLARCHYIDLADASDFVCDFSETLNHKAKERGVTLMTGASTVPALTGAVLDHYLPHFEEIESIDYGISPGNKTERGRGTVASILSYVGQKFSSLRDGKPTAIFGWQGLRRFDFGKPIGKRWMSHCEIPDLRLMPKRYPNLKNIRFQAGLEVTFLHLGLWLLSGLTRLGLIKSLQPYSKMLTRMSDWFFRWGSDAGGMFVLLNGRDHDKGYQSIEWQLVAENSTGPNVPTVAAEIMINKLSENSLPIGAYPCIGFLSLSEFFKIAGRWGIYQKDSVKPASKKTYSSYEKLLGPEKWNRLHPGIKYRFSEKAPLNVSYTGVMEKVHASFVGRLFAQFFRMIGTPLVYQTGKNIPTRVNVFYDEKLGGITWDRYYDFNEKKPIRVKSTKCIRSEQGLVELVGGGFGMSLNVFEENQALYFESADYFWQLGKLKIVFPEWLSPGKTIVRHKALKNQTFEFSFTLTHAWLGRLYHQVGIFK